MTNSDLYLKEISIESDYLRLEWSFKDHIIPIPFPLAETLFTSSGCSKSHPEVEHSHLLLKDISLTSNLYLPSFSIKSLLLVL